MSKKKMEKFKCWGCDKIKAIAGNIYCNDCQQILKRKSIAQLQHERGLSKL